jgi:hypothetical protein
MCSRRSHVPRAKPFTQRDIDKRAKLTGLPAFRRTLVEEEFEKLSGEEGKPLSEETLKRFYQEKWKKFCEQKKLNALNRLHAKRLYKEDGKPSDEVELNRLRNKEWKPLSEETLKRLYEELRLYQEARRRARAELPTRREYELDTDPSSGLTFEMWKITRTWDFNLVIDVLGIKPEGRKRVKDELRYIGIMYNLEILAEHQETPGRLAAALKLYRKAKESLKSIDPKIQSAASAEIRGSPFSIIQEAMRNKAEGRGVFGTAVRRGRTQSQALNNAVRGLQALAGRWNDGLTWHKRSLPEKLIDFIVAALDAMAISFPHPKQNLSKFLNLMANPKVRPHKLTRGEILERVIRKKEAELKVTVDEEPFPV